MVEAPRIRILYENIRFTKGKQISKASGTSYKKFGVDLIGYIIRKWWYAGKYIYTMIIKNSHPTYVIRTHMMMYGRIVIDKNKETNPKLRPFMILELTESDGTCVVLLEWYLSQIKLLDPNCKTDSVKSNYTTCTSKQLVLDSIAMMKFDVSNPKFDLKQSMTHIENNILEIESDIATDLLLNQEFFPGVGNILQQEALYRCSILPTKTVKEIGINEIKCLITELVKITDLLYQSYLNKLTGSPHEPILQIYHKSNCPLGHKTITKYLGYHNRRTTWCPICQQ